MVDPVTVAAALRRAESCLHEAGIEAPRIQATSLLAHTLGLDRAGLLARLHDPLADEVETAFRALVERRTRHEPLQYLLGHADFLDFSVRVGPGVFIPRPETEQLVETALAAWNPAHDLAVDLCSGSGAIAIALARARRKARVLAVELTAAAVAAARLSAHDNGVDERVLFLRGDLLSALHPGTAWRERLGCLVCNPPYAAEGEVAQPEVRDHEPPLAWLAGPRGTEAYERLVPAAAELLLPGRALLLELGYGQAEAVRSLLAADGRWTAVRIDEDFQGIPRVVTAMRAA